MGTTYPYVTSPGPLMKTIDHLRRKTFPKEVTASTLKKLGIAPKNESYIINLLRFLGFIDENGAKIDAKTKAFFQQDEEAFAKEVEKLVRDAYAELFDTYGEEAWKLDRASLIQFFRTSSRSGEIVGQRQATTFECLAELAGHVERRRTTEVSAKKPKQTRQRSSRPKEVKQSPKQEAGEDTRFALTVRVEVNLPADGDQETYDRIFRSLRERLIDAK